jgi:hypothetical protein
VKECPLSQLANLFRTRLRKIAESASIRKRFYGWKEALPCFQGFGIQSQTILLISLIKKKVKEIGLLFSIELWKALSSSDTDSPLLMTFANGANEG